MAKGLLLALFGAVAVSGETLKLGYGLGNGDLQFDFQGSSKSVGRSYPLTIEPWTYANQLNGTWQYFLSIRLELNSADCPQCFTSQVVRVNYAVGSSTASNNDALIADNIKGTDLVKVGGVWVDIPITLSAVPVTYAVYLNITCTSCTKSAELTRLEAIVRMKDVTTISPEWYYGGFDRDMDRNTDWFTNHAGGFGPIMRVQPVVANDFLVVLPDIGLSSQGGGVVYYFSTNMSAFADGLSLYDASTLQCANTGNTGCSNNIAAFPATASANFRRAPSGSYGSGEFASEHTKVTVGGPWFISAFVVRSTAVKAFPEFRFAVGVNAEPAPAAISTPTLVSVVVSLALAVGLMRAH